MQHLELMGWACFACYWVSFGAFCVSDKEWNIRDAFGATLHAGNAGIIMAMLGISTIGVKQPWTILGLACSTSIGWVRKTDIIDLLLKILKK